MDGVERLLKAGADVKPVNSIDITALNYAALIGKSVSEVRVRHWHANQITRYIQHILNNIQKKKWSQSFWGFISNKTHMSDLLVLAKEQSITPASHQVNRNYNYIN